MATPHRSPGTDLPRVGGLQLIAEGFANGQVVAELSISIKTVEKHRQQVMNKLDIHDVAGLTRYAIARAASNTRCLKSTAGLVATAASPPWAIHTSNPGILWTKAGHLVGTS